MNAPVSEPMPPNTTTTNTMVPTAAAMPGSVTKALPPITPARPASAAPPPNTSMNTRGTLWPSASTVAGCVSAAWITRPMRGHAVVRRARAPHQLHHLQDDEEQAEGDEQLRHVPELVNAAQRVLLEQRA